MTLAQLIKTLQTVATKVNPETTEVVHSTCGSSCDNEIYKVRIKSSLSVDDSTSGVDAEIVVII